MFKLIVGLGNPGTQYERSRHNAGFIAAEVMRTRLHGSVWTIKPKFSARLSEAQSQLIIQPQTFMNKSGEAVGAVCRFYKIKPEEVLVLHDDLDITLGEFKLVLAKGPKVHNGVASVEAAIGVGFWRGRIGVDNRTPEERRAIPGERYVLTPMSNETHTLLLETIQALVQQAMEL